MRFKDQVVMVTGAAVGIGAAVAEQCAREGGRVAVVDLDAEGLAALAERLRAAGGEVLPVTADATVTTAVGRAVDAAVGRWGRLDALVNNAGGFYRIVPLEEIDEDDWDAIIRLNLRSAYACTRAVAPIMKRQRRGRIVNLASVVARTGSIATAAHYAAAKAGILGFTKQMALELAPHGITVNAVAPGTTATARVLAARTPEATRALAAAIPLGRLAEPADIAEGVLFLASDAARHVTGAVLDVNGGQAMV